MPPAVARSEKAQPAADRYAIRVRGLLEPCWSEWFAGLTVTPADGGDTVLSGPVADQAALYGLLARVRDLNLTLLSVERLEAKSRRPRRPTPRRRAK